CYRSSRAASAAVAVATKLHRSLGTYAHAVDRYLVPSQFMARTLARYANIEEHKLIVKANSVTLDPGPQTERGEYLLFVGRLTVEKGILTLLDAYARLQCAPPLRIVGEGPLHAQLAERKAADTRLQHVELVGALPHEQAVACIRAARALIVPSQWYEGVPLSLLEAFACAVPVVAGRIGSLAEVVRHGDNGLLFEAGDAADLARVISLLLNEPEQGSALGARGRESYLAHHTLEQNAHALAEIYKDLIEERSKR
ncbi:MAG TPA: glycosyltransferase family 4 protein, partial [Polyangiales bacterium]|nr:glycosyltransferase family 4 protein [Polyangiales bacterium]